MRFSNKPDVSNNINNVEYKEVLAKKFLLGANISDTEPNALIEKMNKRKRWEDVKIEKETVTFNFRIPKKDMQQLKYISQEKKISLNSLCLMAIQEQNKKILKDFEEPE